MKQVLKRRKLNQLYYYKNGIRIDGIPDTLQGNVSGLWGDASGLRGDIDDCELTDEDRVKGVNIMDLVSEP